MSGRLTQDDDRSTRLRDVAAGTGESDAETVQSGRWRKWLATLLGVAAALTAVVYVGIVLIDPFSTGRLTPIKRIDVATSDTVFGHAARVRDPRYDAAVIGNSHAILIDPARLSDMTRMHIVQVATVATVPREQFMIARAFVRNHRKVAALIVVLDELSCQTSEKTFPFYFPAFLFEDSDNRLSQAYFFFRCSGNRRLSAGDVAGIRPRTGTPRRLQPPHL
jgi:hypothetical protein